MKAIVTGGAGFIGGHLVDKLIAERINVIVIDNLSNGRLANIQQHKDNPLLQFYQLDVAREKAALLEIAEKESDVDYVFHLAALADIVPSINNPDEYFQANVQGTLNVLEMAKKFKKLLKFQYTASSSCYGIPDNYPTSEQAEIRPQYPYALTKRLGEELVLHWGQVYKLPVISTRLFNVYGPRSRTSGTYGAVFGVFLAQKLDGRNFTVVGDGRQTRDFTYVTDVVEAIYQATLSSISQEVFNIGSGNTYSVNRLTDLLGGEKTFIPKRPGEPDCTFADISKIQNMIGWFPRVSFEDGVSQILDNIDYWKDAPVWTPESIAKETELWFKSLS